MVDLFSHPDDMELRDIVCFVSPQSPPSPWHVPEGKSKWRSELTKAGVSVVKRAALSELPLSQEHRAVLTSLQKQAEMLQGGWKGGVRRLTDLFSSFFIYLWGSAKAATIAASSVSLLCYF